MTRSTPSKIFVAALLGLSVSACASTVVTRGNMTDPEALTMIKAGATSRDQVVSLLGTPTSVGTFDQNIWYYIGQKTEKIAFFKPSVMERRVVVIHFNDDTGLVSDIKQMDASQGQDVEMVERTTPTNGREIGFLEQMVGNLGRFSARDKSGKSPGS